MFARGSAGCWGLGNKNVNLASKRMRVGVNRQVPSETASSPRGGSTFGGRECVAYQVAQKQRRLGMLSEDVRSPLELTTANAEAP